MLRFCSAQWMVTVFALLMVARLHAAEPVSVVSPADFKDKEGESETQIFASPDIRIQQIYLASDFVPTLPNGGYIKGTSKNGMF